MNKRRLVWSVIPLCLFLVTLGIWLPNLANLHSTPKSRPRAVIESTERTSEVAAGDHQILAFELCNNLPTLLPRTSYRVGVRRETCRLSSVPLPQIGARAPPCPNC